MKLLCKIADSFIYVVSRMGVTGATGTLSTSLPDLLDRVHRYSNNVPAAVGFGVSTKEHYLSVGGIAEGVVIGSQIVNTLADAPSGQGAKAVEDYCASITGRRPGINASADDVKIVEGMNGEQETNGDVVHVDKVLTDADTPDGPGLADQLEALNMNGDADPEAVPSRFGEFGGQYVPESLMDLSLIHI